MVLAAVQEEVLRESKQKTQSAQRWPTRRMGKRSREVQWRRGGPGGGALKFCIRAQG
jgi:hypothetical protein